MTLLACALAMSAQNFAPGAYIQRTMRLLEEGREARILFYGQSITVQDWWKTVERDLRRRYPKANLVVENRAIGGFAANLLGRIAPIDVIPFRPDLVIMHDYGGEPDYEAMVLGIRRNTSAELLLQTDHHTGFPGPSTTPQERQGFDWHNAHVGWMQDLGRRLKCGVVDVRGQWKDHLDRERLAPSALLSDSVHLNKKGEDLMAQIVLSYLVRDRRQPDGLPNGYVQTTKSRWEGNHIRWEFEGTRVDCVPAAKRVVGEVRFLIDGRPPSSYPGAYSFTRPTNAHKAWFPALIGVRAETLPVIETWTATLTNISSDGKRFDFALKGSVTGEDGAGTSGQPFRSNSGRILIDPKDWAVDYGKAVTGETPPEGFEVKWHVFTLHRDRSPLVSKRTMPTFPITQGLPPGKHTLEIVAQYPGGIEELRAYRPALDPDSVEVPAFRR